MFGRVVIDFYLMCSCVQLQTQKPKARPTWPLSHIKERERKGSRWRRSSLSSRGRASHPWSDSQPLTKVPPLPRPDVVNARQVETTVEIILTSTTTTLNLRSQRTRLPNNVFTDCALTLFKKPTVQSLSLCVSCAKMKYQRQMNIAYSHYDWLVGWLGGSISFLFQIPIFQDFSWSLVLPGVVLAGYPLQLYIGVALIVFVVIVPLLSEWRSSSGWLSTNAMVSFLTLLK